LTAEPGISGVEELRAGYNCVSVLEVAIFIRRRHEGGTAVTTGSTERHVALAPEDLARVRRLTEEVKGRLYEVGLIMGRTLDLEITAGTVLKYDPRESAEQAGAPSSGQTIEVVIIALPDGTFCCTQDPPGECVCPC
jgi:hypothetical protein